MKVLQQIFVPQDSVNDLYLTVVGLNFRNGDLVKKQDIVIELETSKAAVTIEANVDGFISYNCQEGDEVAVNSLIIQIFDEKPTESVVFPTNQPAEASYAGTNGRENSNKTYTPEFSLKALELIEKNNLSKDIFTAYDFVNEQVVLSYLNQDSKYIKVTVTNNRLPDNVTSAKLNLYKKREIEYLSSVQSSGLVSTLYIDVNVENILESVSKNFTYFKNSILPLIVYECSKLLLKYPTLNSFYSENTIVTYNNVHVGIAMDIEEGGLKVVKLPGTSALTMNEIEDGIFELSNKYLDKQLTTSDLTDITFTITDLSASGVLAFAPLINKDNSAILGISKIDPVSNQTILSLAFDHRVTEGKTAGNFLSELKKRIESYSLQGNALQKTYVCYKCLKHISEDMNDVGFIKVLTKSGEEKYICDLCLFNF